MVAIIVIGVIIDILRTIIRIQLRKITEVKKDIF